MKDSYLQYLLILLISLTYIQSGFGQFIFKNEAEWKFAYEMIHQAQAGHCIEAYQSFDSLTLDDKFLHPESYIVIINCLKQNDKKEEAAALLSKAKSKGIAIRNPYTDSITKPLLREELILMLLEDQGSWSSKDEFNFDPELKQNLIKLGVDLPKIISKVRRIPGPELQKLHVKELDRITEENGFPTYEMVGHHGMMGVQMIIIHSRIETLEKYENDFKENLGSKSLAYLIDKKRAAKKEKQVYGTQAEVSQGKLGFYPIEEEHLVNQRRMNAGMEPLELYARSIGITDYTIPESKE